MSAHADISRASAWLLAARPKTLWASVSPIVIGFAMAIEAGKFHLWAFLATLLAGVLLQVGANFANDYLDYVKGVDTAERLGPLRVSQAGLVTPSAMRTATIMIFGVALLIGAYLVLRAGWPIFVIGLASILFALLYTAGPYPLGYHGWGDSLAFVFYGPVATAGTYYIQALEINQHVLIAGCAPGLFSIAILTVNNLRDLESDAKSGKRTLAVRFGHQFARREYSFAVLAACLLVPLGLAMTNSSKPAVLVSALSSLASAPLIRSVNRDTGATLNDTLAATGKLELLFSVLFSMGWLL